MAPTPPRTPLPASAGGALGAMPVPEARPLAPDEAPIGRSVTDMWALLQSGKPVVQEVRHVASSLHRLDTSSLGQVAKAPLLLPALGKALNGRSTAGR